MHGGTRMTAHQRIRSIMKRLQHYTDTFSSLCKYTPTIFLDEVTLRLLTILQESTPEDAAASVEQHISVFRDLHQKITSLENDILTLAGYGPETEALKQTVLRVNQMVAYLEDLYCLCYDGQEALRQAHSNHDLLYQK